MNRFAAFVLLSLLAAPALAQDGKPDAEGFIREWLFLGPIALTEGGADSIDKTQIKDEGALKPSAGDKQKVDDKEHAWKPIKAADYYFDLNKILDSANSEVLGYLVTYVVADADMPGLKLGIGSNDQAKIYVNGKEVFKFAETRTIDKDSDKVDKVDLKKGGNVIVFKLINEQNDWQGALRFLDKDDKPVTNLKVQTKP